MAEPISSKYRGAMNALARGLDKALNGVDLPSQRRNGGWFTAELDFGVGGLGWHRVTARTTLRDGLPRSRQDGFGACKGRGR